MVALPMKCLHSCCSFVCPQTTELIETSTSPSIPQSSIQTATSILAKLAKDTLPAIDAAKIEEIQRALDEYKNVQTDQTSGKSDATTDRAKLEKAVNDIAVRRREIQFAADDQWPHTNKANAGIRAEFKLAAERAIQ